MIIFNASELSYTDCYNEIVWINDDLRNSMVNLLLKRKFTDEPLIRWVIGPPGSGKTMIAKSIIGEYFNKKKFKFEIEPVYISLDSFVNKDIEKEDFFQRLSYLIIKTIVHLSELKKLRKGFFYRVLLSSRKDENKRKEEILDLEDLEKNMRVIYQTESSSFVSSKSIELKSVKGALRKSKSSKKNIMGIKPMEILFKYINALNQNHLTMSFLFDDVEFIAKTQILDYFIEFFKRLKSEGRSNIAVFIYPTILKTITESKLLNHKVLQTESLYLTLEHKIFNERDREDFFKVITQKRLKLTKLPDGSAITFAIFGAMGNIRRFLFLIGQYFQGISSVSDSNAIKKGITERSYWTNFFETSLQESIECFYPGVNAEEQKHTVENFYQKILLRMKRHRSEYGRKNPDYDKIKHEFSIYPLMIEIPQNFYKRFEEYLLLLINSGYLMFRENNNIHISGDLNHIYFLPLTVLSGAVFPNEVFIEQGEILEDSEIYTKGKRKKRFDLTKDKKQRVNFMLEKTPKIGGSLSTYKRIFNKDNNDYRRRPVIAQQALICPIRITDSEFETIELRGIKRTYCPHCKEEVQTNRKGRFPRYCPECDKEMKLE